jgi:hypothetical protein
MVEAMMTFASYGKPGAYFSALPAASTGRREAGEAMVSVRQMGGSGGVISLPL